MKSEETVRERLTNLRIDIKAYKAYGVNVDERTGFKKALEWVLRNEKEVNYENNII